MGNLLKCRYNGTPLQLKGKIEAEEFDFGGEKNAYHDNEFEWDGKNLRALHLRHLERPDLEDTEGVISVADFETGEWLEYTIEAPHSGSYKISARISTSSSSKRFRIEMEDENSTVTLPNTGGKWQIVSLPDFKQVTQGQHVMRIYSEKGPLKLDYLDFTAPRNYGR